VVEASVRSRLESRASLLGPGVDVATVEVMLPSPAPPPPVGLTGDVTASIADAWPPMSRNVSPYVTPTVASSPTPVAITPTRQMRSCDVRRM
jgi:hypothetical protein